MAGAIFFNVLFSKIELFCQAFLVLSIVPVVLLRLFCCWILFFSLSIPFCSPGSSTFSSDPERLICSGLVNYYTQAIVRQIQLKMQGVNKEGLCELSYPLIEILH